MACGFASHFPILNSKFSILNFLEHAAAEATAAHGHTAAHAAAEATHAAAEAAHAAAEAAHATHALTSAAVTEQ
jgi:hypothetical protein